METGPHARSSAAARRIGLDTVMGGLPLLEGWPARRVRQAGKKDWHCDGDDRRSRTLNDEQYRAVVCQKYTRYLYRRIPDEACSPSSATVKTLNNCNLLWVSLGVRSEFSQLDRLGDLVEFRAIVRGVDTIDRVRPSSHEPDRYIADTGISVGGHGVAE
ncbi:hypothetical protein LZ30DRAFT_801590 [Colletotrichum cereale]|nr:hypothetical protein LZ30DRAFT_801590 [Colletotrichum cereale]